MTISNSPLLAALLIVLIAASLAAEPASIPAIVPPPADIPQETGTIFADEDSRHIAAAIEHAAADAFRDLYQTIDDIPMADSRTLAALLDENPGLRPLFYDQISRRTRRSDGQIYSNALVVVHVRLPMDQLRQALQQAVRLLRPTREGLPTDDQLRKLLRYNNHRAVWGYGRSSSTAAGGLLDSPPPGWHCAGVSERLNARRQAMDHGYEQLMLHVRQLRISPGRRLAEFLDADPRVDAALRAFIRGFPPAGQVEYAPEAICRVSLKVPPTQLIDELKALTVAYDHTRQYPPDLFANISRNLTESALRATGLAIADCRHEVGKYAMLSQSAQAAAPDEVPDPEQARMLAEQAALAEIRESFRNTLLKRNISQSEMTLEQYILTHSEAARDFELILGSIRLVRSDQSADQSVKAYAELPIEAVDQLLDHYAAILARRENAPDEGNEGGESDD